MKLKEYTAAIAIQSSTSKIPTDFQFHETLITIDLEDIAYFKQYFHLGREAFQKDYTEILMKGAEKPIVLKIGYKQFKKDTEC
tara:strand:+ start:14778 stop:15026 length:249 start_codon:yes stop_codon:yes gene_type:complete